MDMVNHPPHYTSSPARCSCGQSVECITIVRHMGFNLGNTVKYIWRADLKHDAIEDLEKAAWYLADEIRRRKCVNAENPDQINFITVSEAIAKSVGEKR